MGIWKKLLPGLLAATLLLINSGAVFAQQTAGQGLEISPPLIELNANPGQTLQLSIRLRNITKQTLVTSGSINDFVAEGEDGQAKILLDPNAQPSPYSLKNWAGSIPSLTLAPNEIEPVAIALKVPSNASPGGHYGVVRFTGLAPGVSSSGVSLSASIGTLVLIKVSGNVVEKASLIDFYTSYKGKKASFFQSGPIGLTERLQNTGNVHFQPIGTVRVTNIFGRQTGVVSVNQNAGNVLPDSIRRFDQTLNKKHLFGRYTAVANIQYDGHNLTKSISFWVIPYKLVAIILGILLVAIALIRAGLKSYAKKAVRKAKAEENSNKKAKK